VGKMGVGVRFLGWERGRRKMNRKIWDFFKDFCGDFATIFLTGLGFFYMIFLKNKSRVWKD